MTQRAFRFNMVQSLSWDCLSPRSQSRAFFFEPQHWGAAFSVPSEPLRAGRVHPDGDSYWQRTFPSQHLLPRHHSGQTLLGVRPAQTLSLLTYLISKNRLEGWEDLSLWAPRSSGRHVSLTSDNHPSHPIPFSSTVTFQKGNFYLKWKSGSESNAPSWLVMRASCRRLWWGLTQWLFKYSSHFYNEQHRSKLT